MPIALITNDDGVFAPGLLALYESIGNLMDVYVVAPDKEMSASSHSLTIHNPIKVQQLDTHLYSLAGTPTDCVAIGVAKLLPEKPSLIVSGINNGPNLGDDLTYSGTVSAAMEGTIVNIPSIAVSLNMKTDDEPHFDTAAHFARVFAEFVIEYSLPVDTLLNINVPNIDVEQVKGVRFTRQGKRVYDGSIHETASPWGENYYWIGGGTPYWEHGEDTDITAVQEGYVSVSPIHLDLTNYKAMKLLRKQWKAQNTKVKEK